MRIESIKVALPSRKLSNDDVVELVRQNSKATYKGELDKTLKEISFLLKYSGAEYRYWLGEGETPIGLIKKAINEALKEANCTKEDIDLLIYVGVDRGFMEPAGSYLVARAVGMEHTQCFDILDACMSWTRALQTSYSLLNAGIYKRIMVINGEFSVREGGPIYPRVFTLGSQEELQWCFAGHTIGEAATATILKRDLDNVWEFNFSSHNTYADLCTLPREGYQFYCEPTDYIGRNGANKFSSFSNIMFDKGLPMLTDIFRCLKVPVEEIKAIFPHGASKKAWVDAAEPLGVGHLIKHIYPRCGNLVSASVPAGIALSTADGDISRGDKLVGWVASAGMSFSSYSFIY
jgi:acyl-CoA:acyl-CoA alkyltransferase